ncbi:MAG TPA: hypothetical protein VE242_13745 [Chthoniobacterales bacterium]|nr:hypothetical protein [Chthoniobacterales bacterium]
MSETNHTPKFSVSTVVIILVVLLVFAGMVWFVTYQRQLTASFDHQRRDERLKNLSDLNAENQKVLTSYRWIDKGKGIVGIPIDRAMQLEVADLAATRPHAAGPITLTVPSPSPSAAQKPVSSPAPASNQPPPNPAGAAPSGTAKP